ncbi:MAG TPA: 3-methyl-2-oxobutanoate hydroxymethyltransferase [Planctomycetes bacterium]|nr:3-methyl-2-oxobutanoate hydroxymethyltransferase [Planctomycetota bacterium]
MARTTIQDLMKWKREGHRWVCLTAYDAPTARVLAATEVPVVLVGDSLGNVILGHDSTIPVTMENMVHHTAAVRRGAPELFIVGDLPFLAVQVSEDEAVRNAGRLIQEGGADAVKLEGGGPRAVTVKRIIEAGIPVMGHLGLTPQNATQLGGYRVQGVDENSARKIREDAISLEQAGAFSIVLECVPAPLAASIAKELAIPIIGIGAGGDVDAQVLVFHDLVGLSGDFQPRFVRRYVEIEEQMRDAVKRFQEDVTSGSFPSSKESFSMPHSKDAAEGSEQNPETELSG